MLFRSVLYPASPRAVTAQRAAELASRLPAFVAPVLLFVNASTEEEQRACDQVPGAWLQFHGDESPAQCATLARELGRCWLRAARIPSEPAPGEPAFDLLKYAQDYQEAQVNHLIPHLATSVLLFTI